MRLSIRPGALGKVDGWTAGLVETPRVFYKSARGERRMDAKRR